MPAENNEIDASNNIPRIKTSTQTSAVNGQVRWSPVKSLWLGFMALITLAQGAATLRWDTAILFLLTCAVTLCLGHSLGMHRRLIHCSYQCPLWLEYFFVYCGTLVGMAGPLGMMRTHDMRDWAQRQPRCHDYFAHRQTFWRDAWWQLHCELHLKHGPQFVPEMRVARSRFYAFLERTWQLQQLPIAIGLWFVGGLGWVVWGVCARVTVCVVGHWMVGYFAHRRGHQDYVVDGAGVQGHNVGLGGLNGILTMGECWHNNHHAFPGSAKLGLHAGQFDPGWWVLLALRRFGLVRSIKMPRDLPVRPTVRSLHAGSVTLPIHETSFR